MMCNDQRRRARVCIAEDVFGQGIRMTGGGFAYVELEAALKTAHVGTVSDKRVVQQAESPLCAIARWAHLCRSFMPYSTARTNRLYLALRDTSSDIGCGANGSRATS